MRASAACISSFTPSASRPRTSSLRRNSLRLIQGTASTWRGPLRVRTRWTATLSATWTLGTSRVSYISSAVALPKTLGESWFPTTRKAGMPAAESLAIRLANSRWWVWVGSRLLYASPQKRARSAPLSTA